MSGDGDPRVRMRFGKVLASVVAVLGLAACGGAGMNGMDAGGQGGDPLAGGDPAAGQELFTANCAACHGPQGGGTDTGPPLVHEVYEPSHHSDAAFLRAVQQGVPPHHWNFGAMPAVPGLDVDDVADIVAHVRSLQREAGIE